MRKFVLITAVCLCTTAVKAQVLTPEDSLAAGLIRKESTTVISGYGEARYTVDIQHRNAEATLKRVVLFVGHKFSDKISLFTELELEDGLVAGSGETGTEKGEIGMEQAFLKFDVNPSTYIVGGLFIPRIGFINENHLPTTFNGVDRPFVEQLVIPSTWRNIGIGVYGNIKSIPGLNYSAAVVNGLNSADFSNGSGIKEGRQQGAKAKGLALAFNGSLLYYINNFRLQVSGYVGGSTAVEGRVADSLHLNHGVLGNPVVVGEADAQYSKDGFTARALFATVNINDADNINQAYANNTPKAIIGTYGEIGYNLLYKKYQNKKALTVFGRYEYMDLNAQLAANGIGNDANKQQYLVGGLTYKPVRGVAIKLDYVQRITGTPNPAFIITPFPQQVPYFTSNGFINLGVGYNF